MQNNNNDDNSQMVDFSALILGFSSAALGYLGYFSFDGKSPAEKNISLAKQNIDIIALLKEKTKDNLTEDESQLIDHLLTDLRMKFIEAAKNP